MSAVSGVSSRNTVEGAWPPIYEVDNFSDAFIGFAFQLTPRGLSPRGCSIRTRSYLNSQPTAYGPRGVPGS